MLDLESRYQFKCTSSAYQEIIRCLEQREILVHFAELIQTTDISATDLYHHFYTLPSKMDDIQSVIDSSDSVLIRGVIISLPLLAIKVRDVVPWLFSVSHLIFLFEHGKIESYHIVINHHYKIHVQIGSQASSRERRAINQKLSRLINGDSIFIESVHHGDLQVIKADTSRLFDHEFVRFVFALIIVSLPFGIVSWLMKQTLYM